MQPCLPVTDWRRKHYLAITLVATFLTFGGVASGQRPDPPTADKPYDALRVGDGDPNRIVLPTNQILTPGGRQLAVGGRPTDVALSPDGRWLAVLNLNEVLTIDAAAGQIVDRAEHKNGSCKGIVFTVDGKRLFASNIRGSIGVFDVSPEGKLTAAEAIKLPALKAPAGKSAIPIGLALAADGNSLWTVLNLKNSLAQIDLASGNVAREIPVGNAPYDVVLAGDKGYVSNWAGHLPEPGDKTGPSGIATRIRVDARTNIAADGTVSVVDLAAGRQLRQIDVGLHPSGMTLSPDGRYLCVANANSDTVSIIDTTTDKVSQTLSTHAPNAPKLFGSGSNALAFDDKGRTLFVSNGTNNAVALFSFHPEKWRWQGCLPTAWYPAGLAFDRARQSLYVANVKGLGSRGKDWQGKRKIKGQVVFGYNSHDYSGSVSLVPLPKAEELAAHTERVFQNNRVDRSRGALAQPDRKARPRPVPAVAGEPSLFKHVLYILKENRTYDQVFGDIPRGEGDPSLCIFGRKVTPNQHKIVDEFVLLDNFYCSGVLSADGHQWADEAYVTDYIEKSFGGFLRSYPYDGGDALAYASSGFLWDAVLARGQSLRVYGEFVDATIRWKDRTRISKPKFLDCLRDFEKGAGEIEVLATANIKTIEPHLCPAFIGFPSTVSDVYRADQFIRELKEFERSGKLPTLMVMLLPNDHTSGTSPGFPTPEASVADNDLALGRIVEAVSKSRFWKETCIFVVEDDPQNGFDHIDGHRTTALVISPYSRLRKVDSTNYNQTSIVRTIELVLGLPPMNQFDASATPMTSCFGERPDLAPFVSVSNEIPLDQMNPELKAITDPRQRHWAEVSLSLPLDEVDEADEDTLNRILWHSVRGRDDTYPAWAVNDADDDDD